MRCTVCLSCMYRIRSLVYVGPASDARFVCTPRLKMTKLDSDYKSCNFSTSLRALLVHDLDWSMSSLMNNHMSSHANEQLWGQLCERTTV